MPTYIKTVSIKKIWFEIDYENYKITKFTQKKNYTNDIDLEIENFSAKNYVFKYSDKEGVIMKNTKNSQYEVYINNDGCIKLIRKEIFNCKNNKFENLIKELERNGYDLAEN